MPAVGSSRRVSIGCERAFSGLAVLEHGIWLCFYLSVKGHFFPPATVYIIFRVNYLNAQLTLEQHGFEIRGFTYMWIFSINILGIFLETCGN